MQVPAFACDSPFKVNLIKRPFHRRINFYHLWGKDSSPTRRIPGGAAEFHAAGLTMDRAAPAGLSCFVAKLGNMVFFCEGDPTVTAIAVIYTEKSRTQIVQGMYNKIHRKCRTNNNTKQTRFLHCTFVKTDTASLIHGAHH